MKDNSLYLRLNACEIDKMLEEFDGVRQKSMEFFNACDRVDEVVLDIEDLQSADSVGLNYMIMLYSNTVKHGGEFRIINVSEKMLKVFEVTGLSKKICVEPKKCE